jgi:hypothetical protein
MMGAQKFKHLKATFFWVVLAALIFTVSVRGFKVLEILRVVVTFTLLVGAMGVTWQLVLCFFKKTNQNVWELRLGTESLNALGFSCRLIGNLLSLLYLGGIEEPWVINWCDPLSAVAKESRLSMAIGCSVMIVSLSGILAIMILGTRPRRSCLTKVLLILALSSTAGTVYLLSSGRTFLFCSVPTELFPLLSIPFFWASQVLQIYETLKRGVGRQSFAEAVFFFIDWGLWTVHAGFTPELQHFAVPAALMMGLYGIKTVLIARRLNQQG